jgi:hypothetical protein
MELDFTQQGDNLTEDERQALRNEISDLIDKWWEEYDWDGKFEAYLEGLGG